MRIIIFRQHVFRMEIHRGQRPRAVRNDGGAGLMQGYAGESGW
jgi:hypothetical protein